MQKPTKWQFASLLSLINFYRIQYDLMDFWTDFLQVRRQHRALLDCCESRLTCTADLVIHLELVFMDKENKIVCCKIF